ncbi:MAG TPA: TonB-dependent receptor plug domain-containing protein [Opitutaceae bacterium]|nr:TonB-dependent receptor plug domain-containing protein [Opitutaceae bacterium]
MNKHCKIGAVVLLTAVTSQWALAQTAPTSTTLAATPPAAAAADDEEITQLSPFEVTAAKDNGYAATETLAGTRIRTNLADVGASIEVLTKQFLEDVGATDNQSLLQYTTNTQVAGTRGTYGGMGNSTSVNEMGNLVAPQGAQRIRGLSPGDVARDYYISDIPWDSFNIDRVDILRGPNSILYGLGSPAGIINASTHSAEFRNFGSAEVRTGSYGSERASVDFNQQLAPGVAAIRVDGLWNNKKYEQDPAFENDRRVFGALRFDPQLFRNPAFHTSIRVKVEHGEINSNRPRTVPPSDSITPWWRPVAVSPSNPFGGMGKATINTVYDANRTDGVVEGNGYGTDRSNTVNYLPWLAGTQVQQPFFFIDGATNSLTSAFAGFINNGDRDTSGNILPISGGLAGLRQFVPFYSITDLNGMVNRAHQQSAAAFPDAGYGQYRTPALLDPSVFDFYKLLIDGPNKREFNVWNTQNYDVQQTFFDSRLSVDLTYDRQHYRWGGESLLGWQPAISLDITKNGEDYYTHPSVTGVTNRDYGRPFVYGAGGNGGSVYTTDRKYKRASVLGELRPSDLTRNDFLLRLFGKQRFNGVAADEQYYNSSVGYQSYANSQAWQGFWNQSDGSTYLWSDRSPQAVIYLGPSVVNKASSSGLNIPNIQSTITLPDTGVRVFDSTWQNYAVAFNAPWNVPTSLNSVFNGIPVTGSTTQLYQNSNPANYVGWTNVQDNLMRYNNGADKTLTTSASQAQRETKSYSGSYQGFLWNDAIVATLGWRYDEVKSKAVVAQKNPADRQTLNLDPSVYRLPDGYPDAGIAKGHSTSGGIVVHLNRILRHDYLPLNVSLSYNESSNFQVTNVRTDIYGSPIPNPTGKTYEYGALVATKDNRVSLKVVKYTTRLSGGTSTLSNSYQLGGTIAAGLTWRNIFLYKLGGYDWSTREQSIYRNTWTNAYPNQPETTADAAIKGWNDIQTYLSAKGFFKAWNFTPLGPTSALVDRTTYAANPTQYTPDPNTIANYSATSNTFAVTSDIESKGYEYELTANPTSHWRISVNASETTASQKNVGGAALTEFINYVNSKLINSDGTLTPAGALPRYGGAGNAIYPSIWGPFLSNYTLLKLQEGSASSELRKWQYNVITNYTFGNEFFGGRLKGLGVGGAYHFQDKVVLGYPVLSGGSFATYDLTKPYYGPTWNSIDLWASYERKITQKINWKVQLNVYNVGKKDKLIPISVEPDGHTWAAARIAPVQEWQLTNTFSF